jgi:hypothetical protein
MLLGIIFHFHWVHCSFSSKAVPQATILGSIQCGINCGPCKRVIRLFVRSMPSQPPTAEESFATCCLLQASNARFQAAETWGLRSQSTHFVEADVHKLVTKRGPWGREWPGRNKQMRGTCRRSRCGRSEQRCTACQHTKTCEQRVKTKLLQ